MKRLIIILGTFFLLGMAVTGALASNGSYSPPGESTRSGANLAASPTPTCPPSWTVVTSPTLELRESQLYGIDELSSSDVWAVGIYLSGTVPSGADPQLRLLPHRDHTRHADRKDGYELSLALMDHWDGSRWTVITN